jgi:Domain of unknown function (DUF4760)
MRAGTLLAAARSAVKSRLGRSGGMKKEKLLRPWRLWSSGAKIVVGIVIFLVVVGGSGYYAYWKDQPIAPTMSAVVGGGSLFVAAIAAYGAVARSRRKDTLEAWVKWSDGTIDARRELTRVLGAKTITDEQAKALTEDVQLLDKNGAPLDNDAREKLRGQVGDVLNGLERLAVGVELGIYDEAVLRLIGGTIIARTYERFKPYITARQEDTFKDRQTRAYKELKTLYSLIEEPHLLATLHGNREEIDTARLAARRRK